MFTLMADDTLPIRPFQSRISSSHARLGLVFATVLSVATSLSVLAQSQSEISRLIEQLDDTDSTVRSQASRALIGYGKGAVPALSQTLLEQDHARRRGDALRGRRGFVVFCKGGGVPADSCDRCRTQSTWPSYALSASESRDVQTIPNPTRGPEAAVS